MNPVAQELRTSPPKLHHVYAADVHDASGPALEPGTGCHASNKGALLGAISTGEALPPPVARASR